jgi:hypothetical protein
MANETTSGIKGPNPGDEPIRWPPLPGRRYRIMGDDSGHEYFIEVGDEESVFEKRNYTEQEFVKHITTIFRNLEKNKWPSST